ncbi:hypothetical protein [Companilactobacillus bobalius]|uniref:Uncharacterized protein n=2 Tax=Companilactobacillus bobalius TaxID=2801451 RepID=A0A202F7W6_9LACO|nr:hypothetical protein [Companilactobacillus bobalius]GEO58459.1 hypothetical protein LBO01_15880 [Companilactobacillus paralimentarius]KAE9557591.1 hypothetical protein ATN92_15680 [Companilactobacillus bobalius]KAE9563737.1 hypothetical protein ATN92_03130 [Companilactobacillus bobalius]KRK83483.1 hypothetical protein FC78_GL001439 [Companilactobacillus bobalius DSM 19674]OVE96566.1 hypothetical protein LKACC16343_02235 [Companilactobacillus bobalius]
MNRKKIALLTGLTIFGGTNIPYNNLINNQSNNVIKAAQRKKSSRTESKYPNIMKKLDITSMQQYDSNILFMSITLNNFYIKDFHTDNSGKTNLLLVPLSTSDQYFVTSVKLDHKIKKNQRITIQGFLNGKTKISKKQNFNDKYLDKSAVSVLVDHINY